MRPSTSTELENERARLGSRLRSLRMATNRTVSEVAASSGMSQSKLSRLELARLTPSETDVVAVCDALGVDPLDAQELREHARRLRRRTTTGRIDFVGLLQDTERLYASATTIRQVQAITVPGTLQTSAYARRMAGFTSKTTAALQSDDVINQTVIARTNIYHPYRQATSVPTPQLRHHRRPESAGGDAYPPDVDRIERRSRELRCTLRSSPISRKSRCRCNSDTSVVSR